MKVLSLITGLVLMSFVSFAEESVVQIDPEPSILKAKVKATGHSFEAIAKKLRCDMRIDSNTGVPTKAKISFNVSDLGTDNEKRDTEMLHWLESDQFPEISYTFDSWKNEDHTLASGRLTIHGIELPIESPVHVQKLGDRVVIDGGFEINTTQFKLEVIKKMLFLKVDPLLKIEYHLEGKAQP